MLLRISADISNERTDERSLCVVVYDIYHHLSGRKAGKRQTAWASAAAHL
jgi:hypothetical protein